MRPSGGSLRGRGRHDLEAALGQGVQAAVPLLVRQGEVAVIKSYVGLPTEDTSGEEFKFGSIVKPGHQGIWSEPLRTGKYTLNPRIYEAEIVPTSILTLNWSHITSEAHSLDARLSPIDAKSKEAFAFSIDLQVQIHVPDTRAPKVISMVGTMQNLVNEVLQSAVGNHFRNTLQSLEAVRFIETVDVEGPFGAKGLGESGVIPVSAAVANAVKDAIGVRFTALPITPARVRAALETR